MKFDEVKLTPGYPLQLQTSSSDGQAKKINCRYLGALPGKYVLLSPPANARLRSGQKLVVKAMIANGIAMFPATVESMISSPELMLCLSYPNSVNMKEIRGATRVNVELMVTAENKTALNASAIEGRITDISLTGAKLELKEVVGEIGDELSLEAPMRIGTVERKFSVVATIRARIDRSTKELESAYPAVYGIEFGDLDDDSDLLLHAYVNGEMVGE
ncbi:MAG: flagellar brake protein [Cellvibrionaceae bacterium]